MKGLYISDREDPLKIISTSRVYEIQEPSYNQKNPSPTRSYDTFRALISQDPESWMTSQMTTKIGFFPTQSSLDEETK